MYIRDRVYALQILMSLMIVSFVFVLIMIAQASTDRITEVLKEVPEMENKENAVDVYKRQRQWSSWLHRRP